jgi:YidC/Oxa1 family membrane protein insertase
MDRNNLIGFTLIAVLLFAYFTFFAPQPEPPVQPTAVSSVVAADNKGSVTSDTSITTVADSLVVAIDTVTLENADLELRFSSLGGRIIYAGLKHYKKYGGAPLLLINGKSSDFKLNVPIDNRSVDLNQLAYSVSKDSLKTTISFSRVEGGRSIKQTWSLPASGYIVDYKLQIDGAAIKNENIELEWINRMPLVEKDIADSRTKTALNYHTLTDEQDGLSESSVDPESMSVPEGTDWVGMKQKFFLSAVLNKKGFASGEIKTSVDPNDSSTVKTGVAQLKIASAQLSSAEGLNMQFYIGPNDYKSLDAVANGFSANVYLGWPPVKWVNKYFIVPVFQFLTGLTSNYGLIIIILVIIIRLVLLPLSYKSYLGMAKMRLLKPELDELKLKYQDDQMKFSQEQMKLFSEVGASPFAGCIPLLLQMPILFAMFYLFPSSIEFRQQTLPFADDISTYDSVLSFSFALPLIGSHISIYTLLMTLSTLAITWQNNQISTVDGPMKSLSYIMPLVFFFVLNSFPASLSFYYLVGNIASFGQQLLIKRFVDEDKIKAVMEEHRKKMTSSGTGNKSAFMSKLTDALKASEEARKKNKRS